MVYSCGNDEASIPLFWILSRTPTMEKALFDSLNAKAKALLPNYNWSIAVYTKQGDDCKYDAASLAPATF